MVGARAEGAGDGGGGAAGLQAKMEGPKIGFKTGGSTAIEAVCCQRSPERRRNPRRRRTQEPTHTTHATWEWINSGLVVLQCGSVFLTLCIAYKERTTTDSRPWPPTCAARPSRSECHPRRPSSCRTTRSLANTARVKAQERAQPENRPCSN